ncbi:MAG: hypothetical protein IPK97_15540 [Ahniella sp.]|nr:hypothetical protein [Ahniella sp.]
MSTQTVTPGAAPKDLEHLRLLAIFHYVIAGFIAFFSLFPLLHVGMGIAMLSGVMPSNGAANSGDEAMIGWVFILMGGGFVLFGELVAFLMFRAGRCLKQQKSYTYCLVIAAISCLFMPLGTVLGVFTIIVLVRPSVKTLFGVT